MSRIATMGLSGVFARAQSGVRITRIKLGTLYASVAGTTYTWNGVSWRDPFNVSWGSNYLRPIGYQNKLAMFGASQVQPSSFSANGAFLWNGVGVSPMENGLTSGANIQTVRDAIIYQDTLVVVGLFSNAGKNIAAWDGESWLEFGSGVAVSPSTRAYCAVEFEGKLLVGGTMREVYGEPGEYIVQWDGATWSAFNSGNYPVSLPGGPSRLIVYNGELIAIVSNIYKWDGEEWSILGSGIPAGGFFSSLNQMIEFDGKLIVGGNFTSTGDGPANCIAAWDGTSYSPLGSGLNGAVQAMCIWRDRLIVGGSFTTAGGSPASRIAAWDGSSWSPLGDGLPQAVQHMAEFTIEQP